MLPLALTMTLLAGDAPVELELRQREVRLLDAQLLATSDRVPLGYLFGGIGAITVGVGLIPVAIFLTTVSVRGAVFASTLAAVLTIGAYILAPVAIILGIACLVAGVNAAEDARTLRRELTRKRDALLQGLRLPSTAEPQLSTLAVF